MNKKWHFWVVWLVFTLIFLALEYLQLFPLRRVFAHYWEDKIIDFGLFNIMDKLAIGFLFLFVIVLVVGEIYYGLLTRFFRKILSSVGWTYFFLVFFFLMLVRYYFTLGETFTLDSFTYVMKSWFVYGAMRNLELPIWTNYWYLGCPLLQFYPPLAFVLPALYNLFLGNIHLTVKLYLALNHILSGITIYLFVKELTNDKKASIIAATAYVITFWHTYQVFIAGGLHISLIYALFPLLFFVYERYVNGRMRLRNVVVYLSLLLSAILFTHHGYSFYATAIFGIYVVVRALENRKFKFLLPLASLFFLMLVGSSFILPYVLEGNNVLISGDFERTDFYQQYYENNDLPSWSKLLSWSVTGKGHVNYVGISIFALSIFGGLFLLLKRKNIGLILSYFFSMFLVFGWVFPFYRFLPLVYAVAAHRYIFYMMFFMCVLAGFSFFALSKLLRIPGSNDSVRLTRLFLLIIFVIVCDLGATTFRTYDYRIQDSLGGVFDYLKSQNDGFNNRALYVAPTYPNPLTMQRVSTILPYEAGVQGLFGFYDQGATPSLYYIRSLTQQIDGEVRNRMISEDSIDGLRIFNVRYFISVPGLPMCCEHKVSDNVSVYLVDSSPIVASGAVENINESYSGVLFRDMYHPGWDNLNLTFRTIGQMKLNANSFSVDRIFMRGSSLLESYSGEQSVKVLNMSTSLTNVKLDVDVKSKGYLQLSYSYYPYLSVLVDGEEVEYYETAMHMIIIPTDAGVHEIVINAKLSDLRRYLNLFSLAVVVVLVVILFLPFGKSINRWHKLFKVRSGNFEDETA